jgi:hypothetical protein
MKTQYNVTGSQVHIIGHSLGAHIAGYAGERVHIARITGTDNTTLLVNQSINSEPELTVGRLGRYQF